MRKFQMSALAKKIDSKSDYNELLTEEYFVLTGSKQVRAAAKAKANIALERLAKLASPERERAFVRYALGGAFSL